MKRCVFILILSIFLGIYVSSFNVKRYDIDVTIDTNTHSISGVSTIFFSKLKGDLLLPVGKKIELSSVFLNNSKVSIDIIKRGEMNFLKILSFNLKSQNKIEIYYYGTFDEYPQNPEFSQEFMNIKTDGYIKSNFVYLPPDGYWYPHFENRLSPFTLKVKTKSDLIFVTTGKFSGKSSDGIYNVFSFSEAKPVEPIFLIGGKFKVDRDLLNNISISTYFFSEDEFLSNRYIAAVKRYIKMYSDMIGPYPFEKFAVVENELPTGFGMPSYTLLGQDVLRLPFIVYTSLGHEVLHNWWGNSVFVNYGDGNWCEGLTSYMADHYYKELKGKEEAANYRRHLLVNYMSYVKNNNEISLSEFIERHNPAQRAIGYGKSLMVFHMLRKLMGDEVFYEAVKNFYKEMVWKKASWLDIERIFKDTWDDLHEKKLEEYKKENKKVPEFEKKLDTSLDWFFTQWIFRKGAPKIGVKLNMVYQVGENDYLLSFNLTQEKPLYKLLIPVEIVTEKGKEFRKITFEDEEHEYQIILKNKPLKIIVDPDYDIFRKLYPEEIPPSISTIMGKEELYVYFSDRFKAKDVYFDDLKSVFRGKDIFMVKTLDDALSKVLEGKCLIFLQNSSENLNSKIKNILLQDVDVKDGSIFLNSKPYPIMGSKKAIVVFKNKLFKGVSSMLIVDDGNEISFERVLNKIVHYGKYGYLIFDGEKNILKGEWKTLKSPLILDIK